jgi:hypothetical protein
MNFDFDHPPPPQHLSPEEFCAFCETLLAQNPDIRPDTCMNLRDDERWIQEPFTLSGPNGMDKVAENTAPWPRG